MNKKSVQMAFYLEKVTMLGYVIPDKPELKIREFEIYGAYYCGICKSIGKRYGQLPRLTLSYDSVFLALILAGINPNTEMISVQRCIVHPMKKRSIVYDSAEIDYAADILLMLAYFKLKDDYQDEKNLKSAIGANFMKGIYRKLKQTKEEKCIIVEDMLKELIKLENEKYHSIDYSAEPFAKLMEEVFDPSDIVTNDTFYIIEERNLYRRIGYHLGKWIYLIDAFDDIDDNLKSGSYNPLIYQFNYNLKGCETVNLFKERIRDRVEMNLMCYLAEIAKCYEELTIKKNKGLIENIIYLGLLRKTEQVLKKGNIENAESI